MEILVPGGRIYTDVDVCSRAHLTSKVNEHEKIIRECTNELKQIAIATPRTIVPKGEDVLGYINERVDDLISDILDHQEDIDELNRIDYILDNWKYNEYVDVDTEEGFAKVVCDDKDHYGNHKSSENNPFEMKPMKDMDEYVDLCIQDLNEDLKEVTDDKFVVYFDSKLMMDRHKNFIFKSEEEAIKTVLDAMNLSLYELVNHRYLVNNQNFTESLCDAVNKTTIFTKDDRNKIINNIQRLKSEDFKSYQDMIEICKWFEEMILHILGDRIKIVNINKA